jgi:hypothetical protein
VVRRQLDGGGGLGEPAPRPDRLDERLRLRVEDLARRLVDAAA